MNEDVIAIAGLNGVGKTSVLDAIHFLCIGKSYFSATDVQCIKEGEIQSGVLATIATSEKIELKVKGIKICNYYIDFKVVHSENSV